MRAAVALAFPVFATIAAIGQSIIREKRNRSPSAYRATTSLLLTILLFNVAGSFFFGVYIAIDNPKTAKDALWFMPLLFAPVEYWLRFGPALVAAAAVFALISVQLHRSKSCSFSLRKDSQSSSILSVSKIRFRSAKLTVKK